MSFSEAGSAAPEDLTPQEHELLEFFRKGYGNAYVGDHTFLSHYLRPADTCVALPGSDDFRSAALIRGKRLTAAVVNPFLKERRTTMADLLGATRIVEPDGWITLDASSKFMASAAISAGLQLVNDKDQAQDLLRGYGEAGAYTLSEANNGLVLARTRPFPGDDHAQNLWAWPAKPIE